VSLEQQQKWSSAEDALEQWRHVFASVGVFVFKDAFHTGACFGFCLYDDEFPVIYVNNTSAKTRQISVSGAGAPALPHQWHRLRG
jgi:Zn-dependent peptidase ImmA (M78 family)